LSSYLFQQVYKKILRGYLIFAPIKIHKMTSQLLHINPEIQEAIASGKPIVALESTIISHGMPYPQNVETALKVEQTVRDNGALPATIAIINGTMKAGLTVDEIEILGKGGQNIAKTSRRDMPMLLSQKRHGATTVASTMIIAQLAGIKIFATGGIGGVHRGGHITLDISADLQELARTNVAVVCAGAKSILDIGLTLEYLETHGVPVIGFQTDDFPAFFTRKSGFGVDYRMDTEGGIADMLKTKWAIPLQGGAVIANPVPEAHEANPTMIDHIIDKAVRRADSLGIKGKAITPFLLSEIEKMTEGLSLKTNIQLVLNNAGLAARIAGCMKI
jgi:pseudouridylate synthase